MTKTPAPKAAKAKTVVVVKVTLRGIRPPIWRRLHLLDETSLAELHAAIQAAMGWDDSHLHVFEVDGRHYGERGAVDDVADEKRISLASVVKSGVARFSYTYDFGDDWEHQIAIEKIQPAEPGQSYPLCVAGKRACPPEDCGGRWGYEELLQALANPDRPGSAERLEWVGEEFDPAAFDVGSANARLKAWCGEN